MTDLLFVRARALRAPLLAALCAFLLVIVPCGAHGQADKVIVLQHADSLVGRVLGGEEVRELIGNVHFSQGNTRVSCDHALRYMASGKINLSGNVVIRDDSVTMKSPRGTYYRDERLAEAFDSVSLDDGKVKLTARYGKYYVEPRRAFFRSHVVVRDTASTVTADSLTYFRDEKRSVALGRVKVYSPSDNVTITGGQLEHISPAQFSRVTKGPVLVQIDTTGAGRIDTLVVRSTVMESYRAGVKRMVAIDSVQIVRSDLAAVGGHATFYTVGDSIILRRNPVVWYEKTQVSGDSIDVYLRRRRLHRVNVLGDAFAVSQTDSLHPERFDQITGDSLRMRFGESGLERIDVVVHAISVYHLYEDSLGNGLNKTSGDRIIMNFVEGKVRTIRVWGGVEGQYYPENMIKGREREYEIPGFFLRADRPRIRSGDMREFGPVANR